MLVFIMQIYLLSSEVAFGVTGDSALTHTQKVEAVKETAKGVGKRARHKESHPWGMHQGEFWWRCDEFYFKTLYIKYFFVNLKTFGL